MNISFIGTGIMASSIIKCITEKGLYRKEEITGSGPRLKSLEEVKKRFGINITQKNTDAAKFGDIIILSIKPQVFPSVAEEIKDSINDNQMIVSIMAGVDIETLQRELLHKKIVRAMPNTPAQISEGMTVWTSTKEIKENEKNEVKKIFSSMGKELYFEEEQYVDMATALTGTGPAYVFLFLEAMIAAGVHLGFSRRDARELVYQTTLGSVLFAINSEKHTSELRDMVTSPGGTSADALYEMEKGSFRTIIEKAVYSAFKRTIYLKEIVKKKGGSNVS
ncbi:MAG: pyrroline-5-carboxylate reductase [Caldiserica bacterium CG02_land_8_20_14_3_00_36_38]|nr:pyrroline-5-carboxylate reductase [Caldisericota bacterium]OIP13532.1 MAG: pyrroline-5-carboxylate reductase [Caldisericum sp. CG2_30_36_11]PIP50061.1 MAG: pyrroline-5-carboxylate reductase [Caldiserica bacterium CG23_combo_of_CG06-09_8_20_14_all_35_60]PIV56004.1 MAG: pyrroline-5-carboxylate reductase [Caldiserica bacterium CG02_land_8_20_14_3_00_36_38]PIW10635.1 MAG: pyrroline-5-carboxylate reductase [Caldiserica bacterium CG17_big_fil_post_rev_8_21_14_2_50_35_7]PIX28380.1 MAG: pyrroline-5